MILIGLGLVLVGSLIAVTALHAGRREEGFIGIVSSLIGVAAILAGKGLQ